MNGGVYDAVVIGGGMAGMMAAITLAERGRRVAVVSKGDPVCCLSTGCIDVFNNNGSISKSIKELPADHPYRTAGKKNILESHELFLKIAMESDLPYLGDIGENRSIITPLGRKKKTNLVPKTMEHSDIGIDEHIHIVSFKGLKDFYRSYIISSHKNADFSLFDAGISSTSGIAERFEDRAFRSEFTGWMKNLNIPRVKIGIPAVLGTRSSFAVYNEITEKTERTIFEIPTLPPSMPGLRLFRCLKNALQKRHGDLYWGREISSIEKLGKEIEGITLSNPGRVSRVQGRVFILATGSFVSGGLYASMDSVRETVFGLPVFYPAERGKWFSESFFTKGHEIEKAGVRVDEYFRPIDSPFDNLFVCGSILAHSELMKYGCGHGLAIASGYGAALFCEGQLT